MEKAGAGDYGNGDAPERVAFILNQQAATLRALAERGLDPRLISADTQGVLIYQIPLLLSPSDAAELFADAKSWPWRTETDDFGRQQREGVAEGGEQGQLVHAVGSSDASG